MIITLPFFYLFNTAMVTGVGLLFLGMAWVFLSFNIQEDSKLFSLMVLLIGILAIISALVYYTGIISFDPLINFWLVIVGIMLLVFGVITFLFQKKVNGKWGITGLVSIVLGIIYLGIIYQIIAGSKLDSYYLVVLIGLFLIADGIIIFFLKPSKIIEPLP
ncbi:MAG: hypothetical protein KKF16_04425 [Euryarchaeota archaeon]|nr:hypothetical protein [Euryarchaeota archaeon]MBV1755147.1 hypothetical protein [Methanobacterium sp.]